MTSQPPSILQMLQGVFPFVGMDQKTLGRITPFLEKISLPAGTELFAQEEETDGLFFILVGEVTIEREDKNGKRTVACLRAGDHFGEDALTNFRHRQTRAVTKSRVILVRLARENIPLVYEISPTLKRCFGMLRRTYQLQLKVTFPWHQTEETIYLVSRRHSVFLWLRVVPVFLVTLAAYGGLLSAAFNADTGSAYWLVLAFLLLGLGCLLGVWAGLEWSNDYFILTRDRVMIQKLMIGFFDSRQETPMSAILSTGLDAPFLGRLLGFGSVTARAYTGDLRFNNLPEPDLILAYLEHRRQNLQVEQRREEQSNMHSLLRNRLQPESARTTEPVPVRQTSNVHVNYYTGTFSDLLAKFFGLRREKEGDILYRTHWWILLKRTILPALFLMVVLGFALARLMNRFELDTSLMFLLVSLATIVGWVWLLYNFFDWRNDIYVISGDQLIDINRRPLGSEEKRSAPVKNIQTVQYKRNGIIGLILNFGTVRIQIGNEELTFNNVYNPSVVQIEIFEHLREFNERSRQMDQKRMVDWISTYDGLMEKEGRSNDEIDKENG